MTLTILNIIKPIVAITIAIFALSEFCLYCLIFLTTFYIIFYLVF